MSVAQKILVNIVKYGSHKTQMQKKHEHETCQIQLFDLVLVITSPPFRRSHVTGSSTSEHQVNLYPKCEAWKLLQK